MKLNHFLLGALALAMSACKKDSDNNSTTSSAVFTGSYEREIYQGTDSATIIRFEPQSDKSYKVNAIIMGVSYPFVSGSYSLSGNQATFISTICPSMEGKYTFIQSGTGLSFTTVSDNCTSGKPRSFLISGTWTKK